MNIVSREPMTDSCISKSAPLLQATALSLRIPVTKPSERSLLSNPMRLVRDLYFSRGQRTISVLLDNITFSLMPGERLGLIGPNGAGKSTLLRVLAGIYTPSSGKLVVDGKVKGLFEVSLGMNQQGTGLENIYMRGLQMGLDLKDIRALVPEVLEFSELAEHIDKPIATYSTGMRLRLAIAISTMIEPDILLLDEWIGAGDASFSRKVKARMMKLVEGSRGMVIATHNDKLLKSLCTQGMVLSEGKVAFMGNVDDALTYYGENFATKANEVPEVEPIETT